MAYDPKEAVEYMQSVIDSDSGNRSEGQSDLEFGYGKQWPAEVQNSRILENRPCLTINKIDAYIRQVTNGQRQQRPRSKVHPVNSTSDKKIAEVCTGLLRHIEVNSDADNAIDNAFDFAARIGWGYFRLCADYVRDDSFDQDIYYKQIENPFSVYFDPDSVLPDGSDQTQCLLTDMMRKKAFEKEYPGAQTSSIRATGTGDNLVDWIEKDNIRLAEHFKIEKQRAKLVMLSDKTVTYADMLPPPELLQANGISVVGDRDSFKKVVHWYKCSAMDELDHAIIPGLYIPVIPVYGCRQIIDGRRKKFGMIRFARDPQMMYNVWRTAWTESVAMAPKAKWLMAEGQDEGHENEFARANTAAYPTLRYKQTDSAGQEAPRPERISPEPPPEGAIQSAEAASADLQAVMGMYDPSMGKPSGPKSGTALRAEQGQSEQSNFHYYDNLTRSIKHASRIALGWFPTYYDQQRVMRIIGEDGKPDLVTLNEQAPQIGEDGQPMVDAMGQAVMQVLNDVTVGEYDIVMDTGPGYNTRRLEAQDAFQGLLSSPLGEKIAETSGDIIVRNFDAPGMDAVADRLAAANPLSQVDEKSEVPPQAQMQIKQLQAQLQQAGAQIQQMGEVIKSRSDLKQMEQQSETQRELMRQTAKAHDIEARDSTKRHDTETRALSAQNVAEIKGLVELLARHLDAAKFERESAMQDAELDIKSDQQEPREQ